MPPKQILVVDDDAAILRLVSTILRHEHYAVDTAGGGKEAITKIELTQYDVVVLDLMMPGVSGLDVLRMLNVRFPQIKCVVLMSAASPFEIARVITPNVFATLRKPFNYIDDLTKAVAKCIEASCETAIPAQLLPLVATAA